jgi:hypothetical protein
MKPRGEEKLSPTMVQTGLKQRSELYGDRLGSMEVLIGGMGRRA